MKTLLYTIPVALLVAYSQIVVKWRSMVNGEQIRAESFWQNLLTYFSDVYILSAYASALLGSLVWLVVVAKIPLSIGFPVYIGVTFLFVLIGSRLFLGEQVSPPQMLAALLIFAGIVLGAVK